MSALLWGMLAGAGLKHGDIALCSASLLICAWPCRLFARASKSSRSASSPSCRQACVLLSVQLLTPLCAYASCSTATAASYLQLKTALRSPLWAVQRLWLPAEGTGPDKVAALANATVPAPHGSWPSAAQHRKYI